MNNICRLCIGQNVQLHHVIESEIIPGWTASDAIWELLQIQVSKSDVYPQFICTECIKKLVDFKLFKQQCEINKETLDQVHTESREVGDNEDVVGMVLYGNENQSDIFVKEEDVGFLVEKDPLDLSEEGNEVNSEIQDTSDNKIPSSEVCEPANQVPSKCRFGDQVKTVDTNEITNEYTNEYSIENLIDGEITRLILQLVLCDYGKDKAIKFSRALCWECRVATSPQNTSTDFLLQGSTVGEIEEDPGLDLTSTCKEETLVNSGTEESVLEEISSFCDKDTVGIASDSSVTGERTEGSRTNEEDLSVNVHQTFQCNVCSKNFSRSYSLKTHLVTHTGQRQFKCNICCNTFSQNSHLRRHMVIHSTDRPYQCILCSKTFARKSDLKRHVSTHSEGERYQCHECDKSFSRKSDLKRHITTHSEGERLQCNECKKTFSLKSHIKIHMLIHSEDRPFRCDNCGKAFKRKSDLTSHMITHTVSDTFQCNECKKTFSRLSYLKRHRKTLNHARIGGTHTTELMQ